MKKVNLGSADTRVDGWINYDIVPGDNVDIVGDVRYLFMQNKPDVIRASHLLAHIPPSETLHVLRTWYDTLRDGGVLIVGVPDFDYVVKEYLRDPSSCMCFWRKGFESVLFKQL